MSSNVVLDYVLAIVAVPDDQGPYAAAVPLALLVYLIRGAR